MKPIQNFRSRALFTIVGGSVLINPAFAQEQPAEAVPEVVVTGLRASLESAQGIKQNSDTFVDSITATDIGAFPGQVGRRSAATRSGHHRVTVAVERRQQPLLGRTGHGAHPRPDVRAHGVQRPRQFLGRRLSRTQLQRCVARAHARCRHLQEPDRGDDRRRHRRRREPAHAHALRFGRPDFRADRPRQLRHAFRGADVRGVRCVQQHLGDWQRPLRPAGQRRVLEHRDAHRSGQHDAHRHVLLGLPAGWRRIPECQCSMPTATSCATTIRTAARAGAMRPARSTSRRSTTTARAPARR